ncbi:MAG: RNA ligase [Clostridium butyricum]
MRYLILMRGCPAVGKSTFIKEHGLEPYTLSADNIRLLIQSPVMTVDGKIGISQSNDKKVWDKYLPTFLEDRMSRGEFTVVDATHSKTSDFTKYKTLAEKYRYRVYCVDFTDVPKEEVIKRNNSREEYKRVSQSVIDRMYARFDTQQPPKYATIIKPEEFDEVMQYTPMDLSSYKRIHHIGDLHGCYSVLQEYLKEGIKEDEYYIFCGDYIDRGIENVELLRFLAQIVKLPNVTLLEGNHEKWVFNWGNDLIVPSKEFNMNTVKQFIEQGYSKKEARMFYRTLNQIMYYSYKGKNILVCHGGVSTLPNNLLYTSTYEYINGVGRYGDAKMVDDSFAKTTPDYFYQIHGHRNIDGIPTQVNDRCFNLEGQVEMGGFLRVVTLSAEGFSCHEIKNNYYNKERFDKKPVNNIMKNDNNEVVVKALKENEYVNEKVLENGISSFNFTRSAFFKEVWTEQTVKTRGLFINTDTYEIASRSYEKFFNINERPETQLSTLCNTLKFPLKAYVKYNGYLGTVGYNCNVDELLITSKSTDKGDYAAWFSQLLYQKLGVENLDRFKEYIKTNNCSFVFEVISKNDPHIIEYKEEDIILLDIIDRNIEYKHQDYDSLVKVANSFGLNYKKLAYEFNSIDEFKNWYYKVTKEDWKYNNEYIEGFVLEDSEGFMFKLKLEYYKFWKLMRGVVKDVSKCTDNNNKVLSKLYNPLSNYFYAWLKNQPKVRLNDNIINLRNDFYKDNKTI